MRSAFGWLIVLFFSSSAVAQERPNIILILSDDHANHAISCYGSKINKTPNLDRLAAGGMRFDRAMVVNSLCGPSRASILTGKYTHQHGFYDNQRGRQFDGSQTTFPKLLQLAGYETAIFGKWHLNSDPTGFDRWKIIHDFAHYLNAKFRGNLADENEPRAIDGYTTDFIFDFGLDWLKTRKETNRPFFLMITPQAPHRNWVPDEKHAGKYEDQMIPKPATFDDDLSTRGAAAHECRMSILSDLRKTDVKSDPPAGLSDAERKMWNYQRFIKDYLRVVASVDDNIGRLLDHLDSAGLTRNTVVIYTSDNGFFLGDHGWFDKRFMYEEALRVPLIVRFPAAASVGDSSDAMALNIDIPSTILDLAHAPIPKEMQGRSLKPILTHQPPADWRQSVYYHYYEQEPEHNVAPHYGVRTATHKLIHFYTHDQWELYDLPRDPHELQNRYDDPAYAALRDQLKAELHRLREEFEDATPKKP
jgi:arylsulfatase A-like enzyme